MKLAIITDTHYNYKKGNKFFHDYFEKFYNNIFFPTLRKYNIDTVIHLGDFFDNRKTTDYWSIDWTNRVVLAPLKIYDVHLILGNHDIFYKNTTKLNSPMLLLNGYDNVKIYPEAKTINLGGTDILFVPWITSDSIDATLRAVKTTPAKVVMGHLELNGFSPHKGNIMESGMDPKIFKKFDRVFSGHYHTRGDDGKIFYLGNPYEMFWNDYDDQRGFCIFDTDTYELIKIDNPYQVFKICYYDEDNLPNVNDYENCIVKLIIKNKTDQLKYEKFLNSLIKIEPEDLKIIENVQFSSEFIDDDILEIEDTLSLLKKYVDESEIKLNKNRINKLIHSIYQESFQLQ
jgi:DNA repair exonuclease SbcCD nuclease subunit